MSACSGIYRYDDDNDDDDDDDDEYGVPDSSLCFLGWNALSISSIISSTLRTITVAPESVSTLASSKSKATEPLEPSVAIKSLHRSESVELPSPSTVPKPDSYRWGVFLADNFLNTRKSQQVSTTHLNRRREVSQLRRVF